MPDSPWILLLYTLPTGRGSARVSVWRKLKKSGALPFKSSAYLLPNQPELLERFQWLAQQVIDAGGEASLAFVSELEGVSNDAMIRQFQAARAADYDALAGELSQLVAKHKKKAAESFPAELEKLRRQFEEIRRLDFFDSPKGNDVSLQIERAASLPEKKPAGSKTRVLSPKSFSGRTWLTRPHPAIDRVGSAWLIVRFIDSKPKFVFSDQPKDHPSAIPYDMMGVEFTHHGDDCTFETLLKRFGLKNPALKRIGEMIHDADLDDGKFQTNEAFGLDRVFKGWAKLGKSDQEILTSGFACFDALHAFLRSERCPPPLT
jgi:hypothetical protein